MAGREKTQTTFCLNVKKVHVFDSWGFSLEECNGPLVFSHAESKDSFVLT